MSEQKVRIGLLGAGGNAGTRLHFPAFAGESPRVELVAVMSRQLDKAQAVADKTGASFVTSDWREVVEHPDVDAIDVCLPDWMHREVTEAAVRAGKHVLLEKPSGATVADAIAIEQLASTTDLVIQVAENVRYRQDILEAQRLVQSGAVGTPFLMRGVRAGWVGDQYARMDWAQSEDTFSGGFLLSGGVHDITVYHALLGDLASVQAYGYKARQDLTGPDTAVANFKFKSGAVGQMSATYGAVPGFESVHFFLYGSDGTLAIGRELRLHTRSDKDGKLIDVPSKNAFVAEIDAFADSILDGAPVLMTAREGRKDVEAIFAIIEASNNGQEVVL